MKRASRGVNNRRAFRNQVDFYTKAQSKNEFGENDDTYLFAFSVYCEITDSQINNGVVADGLEKQESVSLNTRFDSRITSDMVVRHNSKYFEIDSVENLDGLDREYSIRAIKYI